jgi:DNA invertase Pin-like site-specific DNA recombinase
MGSDGTGASRAAIWARVSTTDQHAENQLDELRAWGERRGLEVVAEIVTDDSGWQNGTGAKGREFDRARAGLLDGARLGSYSIVLTWAVDRLSRRGIEDTLAALRRLAEAGCAVWSYQEPWAEDLRDPRMRELFLAIAGWVAEMESARRSERVKAGLARRKREGKPVGGRKPGARDKIPRSTGGYSSAWTPERREALVARNRQRAGTRFTDEIRSAGVVEVAIAPGDKADEVIA